MDSKKVVVHKTTGHGNGVFARVAIKKGEAAAAFDGTIYDYDYSGWNNELYNHVIQFEPRRWRDSNGIARLINHSCDPNCGIRDLRIKVNSL